MKNNTNILAQDIDVKIQNIDKIDYLSLADIVRYKYRKISEYVIQHWMRSKDTIEFLCLWEKINNENFIPSNSIELKTIVEAVAHDEYKKVKLENNNQVVYDIKPILDSSYGRL